MKLDWAIVRKRFQKVGGWGREGNIGVESFRVVGLVNVTGIFDSLLTQLK